MASCSPEGGVDEEIALACAGLGFDSDECDFPLEEQSALVGADAPSPARRPKTLVVAALVIDAQGRLLMVQEAKRACAGKWYLPAGRVEAGEGLAEAAARELAEETGLRGDAPASLVAVETAHGAWFRFSFAFDAERLRGELKTPARADAESLQAIWAPDPTAHDLRADDFLPLVERARLRSDNPARFHADVLPCARSQPRDLLRLVAVIKRRSTNRAHVLVGERTRLHLPTAELDPGRSLHSTLRRFLQDIFGPELPQHRPHGLLGVEHAPDEARDGVRLTVLVAFRPPLEEAPIIGKYAWHEVSKELGERLLAKLADKNATVMLRVVR